ncbi:alpha/beta fold hydrolase [Bacillus lacus]|uniref:Alpha/beta fold hydrolase n=1 Tax=Metabacillus lacus TaxID=1983721 RepID=A0A7X2J1N6_9BACI|nr:alpha/beta hydrolase [Metabacillus lacus]MRX73832.1 alpha/beta fold hydrolase [Metabacillus lacus]
MVLKIESNVKLSFGEMYVVIYQSGPHLPYVILDAGYGNDSSVWEKTAGEIGEFANVIVYDRAGVGKSSNSCHPRTAFWMAEELYEIMENLDIDSPILAGHSYGGVIHRVLADRYPTKTAGLVLIDSTPHDYQNRFLPNMSEAFQNSYYSQFTKEGNAENFKESLKQLQNCSNLLDVPVTVLSAGKKQHYNESSQTLWHDMQREMLQITKSRSTFLIAEHSGHFIQREQPEVVIDAVRSMVISLMKNDEEKRQV